MDGGNSPASYGLLTAVDVRCLNPIETRSDLSIHTEWTNLPRLLLYSDSRHPLLSKYTNGDFICLEEANNCPTIFHQTPSNFRPKDVGCKANKATQS